MKNVFVFTGLLVSIAVCGCAMQLVKEDMNKHCADQGKRAFVLESEHQGIPLFPLFIESANAMYYCVSPEQIKSMPGAFGADVVEGADFKGVGVMTVQPGSIADKAGLKAGDVVYEYADLPISRAGDLRTAIDGTAQGDRAPIKLRRNKAEVTATAQF